ncbi:MAG: acyl-CoA dehydrogenase, partial [Azonexus sp.]|nr:acyl-CoA dehydrogenase [Azonexus sp.]
EAMRAIAYVTAGAQDKATQHPDAAVRTEMQAFVDLMIPVVKGWGTESAIDIASLGVQVHGGMGYIEETGAAQHLRDARITAIYEGTTAIQANDLVGRKIAREKGATMFALIARMRDDAKLLTGELSVIGERQVRALAALEQAVVWIVDQFSADPKAVHAGAVPFLNLFGIVAGGWQLGRAANYASQQILEGNGDNFWPAKCATARFFADHFLTQVEGLSQAVMAGAVGALAIDDDSF